jgi:hypothetical protein
VEVDVGEVGGGGEDLLELALLLGVAGLLLLDGREFFVLDVFGLLFLLLLLVLELEELGFLALDELVLLFLVLLLLLHLGLGKG